MLVDEETERWRSRGRRYRAFGLPGFGGVTHARRATWVLPSVEGLELLINHASRSCRHDMYKRTVRGRHPHIACTTLDAFALAKWEKALLQRPAAVQRRDAAMLRLTQLLIDRMIRCLADGPKKLLCRFPDLCSAVEPHSHHAEMSGQLASEQYLSPCQDGVTY